MTPILIDTNGRTSYSIYPYETKEEAMEKFSKRQVIKFLKDFLGNHKKKKKEEALWSEEVLEAIKTFKERKEN